MTNPTEIQRKNMARASSSKLVGKTLGIARKASVVVVRISDRYGQDTNELRIDGLLKTYDRIAKHQPKEKGHRVVVNMS